MDNGDLAEVTYSIAAMTLLQLDLYDNISEASAYLKNLVHSGKALEKFRELIIAQGGAAEVIDNYDKFTLPCYKVECESKRTVIFRILMLIMFHVPLRLSGQPEKTAQSRLI